MQLIKQRSSVKWLLFLITAGVLAVGAFVIAGVAFFMLMVAGVQEEPPPETAIDASTGAGGILIEGKISPIGENQIPKEFIPIYKAAGKKYHVPWNLLAGHHFVETRFSSIDHMVSPVGATGHMQFMPCTWVNFGNCYHMPLYPVMDIDHLSNSVKLLTYKKTRTIPSEA